MGIVMAFSVRSCLAQELETRRWSHLPVNVNFAGGGYVYTAADISFDPVLRLEGVEMEKHSIPLRYTRTFELAGKSARVDLLTAYQDARWSGLVDGVPATTARNGMSDLSLRFGVNILGAPPLTGQEFVKYRARTDPETIVGLGLEVQVPTGNYLEDRLLNLGTNRFTFRPQLGILHKRGKWSTEVTAVSWIYTDNNDFFDGYLLEKDPFQTIESHIFYTFRPGLWVGAGVGWGYGGRSTLNGVPKDDVRENIGWELSLGYPITRDMGLKMGYIGLRTQSPVGADSDNFFGGLSLVW